MILKLLTRALHIAILTSLLWLIPAQAGDLPPQASVSGFRGYAQAYNLSCESRSAADWAAFFGVSVSERDFQAALPRSDDPNLGFVGSPYDVWGNIPPRSYGVHAGPVAALLVEYGLPAQAHFGLEWDALRAEIAANRPVIVWVISEMWAGRPMRYTTRAGETITVAPFEHTMVLTGYTETSVTLMDAYSGISKSYSLAAFLKSWSVLGNMAVMMAPGPPPEPEEPPPPETQIVQAGEYLHTLAAQWKLPWQGIAALNDLAFPYLLEAGQTLRLRGAETAPALPDGRISELDWVVAHYPQLGPPTGETRLYLALISQPLEVAQDPAQEPAGEGDGFYIVQPGDYLAGIAERFDLSWLDLADLNGLDYPYTVYPGQRLKLK